MSRLDKKVSDHAVLRFIETHAFVDVERLRAQLHAEVSAALEAGASRVTINGTSYVMRDGCVITCTTHRKKTRKLSWPPRA